MKSSEEIRAIIKFCFDRGLTPSKALLEIVEAKGQKSVSIRTIKRWYSR